MRMEELDELTEELIRCTQCPRLVRYRETVLPRAAFRNEDYWRRPVPPWGSPGARLMIVGLAPAAHGGNRTGRIFTGDPSAQFLFKALYMAGLASEPRSISRNDGVRVN
jgi:uracil-DNA glycosylase